MTSRRGRSRADVSPRTAGSTVRTTGSALSMNAAYACASAGLDSAIESTVASIDRWKRTRRPSAWTAMENGSISRYSSPAPARSSSAGMVVMLMMLWATEWVSKR